MATKEEYDAAYAAGKVVADAEIANVEKQIPVFFRPQAEQQIEAHRAEIEKCLRAITRSAVDAAEQVRDL